MATSLEPENGKNLVNYSTIEELPETPNEKPGPIRRILRALPRFLMVLAGVTFIIALVFVFTYRFGATYQSAPPLMESAPPINSAPAPNEDAPQVNRNPASEDGMQVVEEEVTQSDPVVLSETIVEHYAMQRDEYAVSNFSIAKSAWQEVTEQSIGVKGTLSNKRLGSIKMYRMSKSVQTRLLDVNELLVASSLITVALPFRNTVEDFQLLPSDLMSPELKEKFPNIRCYQLRERGGSVTGEVTVSDAGVFASVADKNYMEFISPTGDHNDMYVKIPANISPSQLQLIAGTLPSPFHELPLNPASANSPSTELPVAASPARQTLKKKQFRIAIAATAEYTQFHGGKDNTIAAIISTMNTVNSIYETELGVTFEIVGENAKIVFEDSLTDGFTNRDARKLIMEGQPIIDSLIGNSNYDIGHVFSTCGSGIADFGVVCDSGDKAKGVSGLKNQAQYRFFDVDYVCHELGHQFDAHHIFNGSGCSNRDPDHAVEPGSGSTIMGYAGICDPFNNLQPNSDRYFNTVSLSRIKNYVDRLSCPVVTDSYNHAPEITSVRRTMAIPPGTAFVLSGKATDSDGDPVLYCWEQTDRCSCTNGDSPEHENHSVPNFRSFTPAIDSFRICPQMRDIVRNEVSRGEIYPQKARDLRFTLTVRDYKGGVAFAETLVRVIDGNQPFKITYPNNDVTWAENSTGTVTWDVAKTNEKPIRCSKVNILLSTNGGLTFDVVLALNVDNTGEKEVFLPKMGEGGLNTARIKVEAADHSFFDISDTNFSIKNASTN